MDKVKELSRKHLLPEKKASYDILFRVAFILHNWGEKEIEMMVIKKLSGLKIMIDYIERD